MCMPWRSIERAQRVQWPILYAHWHRTTSHAHSICIQDWRSFKRLPHIVLKGLKTPYAVCCSNFFSTCYPCNHFNNSLHFQKCLRVNDNTFCVIGLSWLSTREHIMDRSRVHSERTYAYLVTPLCIRDISSFLIFSQRRKKIDNSTCLWVLRSNELTQERNRLWTQQSSTPLQLECGLISITFVPYIKFHFCVFLNSDVGNRLNFDKTEIRNLLFQTNAAIAS